MKKLFIFGLLIILITRICVTQEIINDYFKLTPEKDLLREFDEEVHFVCDEEKTGKIAIFLPLLSEKSETQVLSNIDFYFIEYEVIDTNNRHKKALLKIYAGIDKFDFYPEGTKVYTLEDGALKRRRFILSCIPFEKDLNVRIKGYVEEESAMELIYNKLFIVDVLETIYPVIDLVDEITYSVSAEEDLQTCDVNLEKFEGIFAKAGNYKFVILGEKVQLNGSYFSFKKPEGVVEFLWKQVKGPQVELSDDRISAPFFKPPIPGEYVFSLVVSDSESVSEPDTVTVSVQPSFDNKQSLFVSAGADKSVIEGTMVELKGDYYSIREKRDENIRFFWEQISGQKVELTVKPDKTAHFIPPATGVYEFKFVVSDGVEALEDFVTLIVKQRTTSDNKRPVANAGRDMVSSVGKLVSLDGRGSLDPDGDKLEYKWKQVCGPEVKVKNNLKVESSFVPEFPGYYRFELEVYDGELYAYDSVGVNVVGDYKKKSIELVKEYDEIDVGSSLVISGKYAYFADGFLKFHILDISDLNLVKQISSTD